MAKDQTSRIAPFLAFRIPGPSHLGSGLPQKQCLGLLTQNEHHHTLQEVDQVVVPVPLASADCLPVSLRVLLPGNRFDLGLAIPSWQLISLYEPGLTATVRVDEQAMNCAISAIIADHGGRVPPKPDWVGHYLLGATTAH